MRIIEPILRLMRALDIRNAGGSAPGVSEAGVARLSYDGTNDCLQASENGGAYSRVPLLSNAAFTLVQGTPAFTVGAEATNVINVAVQLKDSQGVALTAAHVVRAWLSDTAGAALSGTPPSGTVVIGTNGVIVASLTAKTHLIIITSATGAFDLNITEAGVKSYFLNLEYQGKVFSQQMTWA